MAIALLTIAVQNPRVPDSIARRTALAGTQKPNIVFILTDDLDEQSIVAMPRLKDLLIARGATFRRFFISFPVCCPSRASILRGQYAHNTGVLGNRPPIGGFETFHARGLEQSTIAVWLAAAGYRTGYFGKYLNGYPRTAGATYVPPGWAEWHSPMANDARPRVVRLLQAVLHRFFGWFDYWMNENGTLVAYGSTPDDYFTDVLARKTADFIRRGGPPFFIQVATFAPTTVQPAPRHRGAFSHALLRRSPSFNESDMEDKPRWLQAQPRLTADQISRIDRLYRRRLESLQAVDELIGTLIETLRATGQLSNTFVFFSSDNGFHLGEHRLPDGKNTAYEEDIRVPLIVIGPGVPAGRTVDHLAVNIDLAPTWAQLAGIAAPTFVDGRSLVPLLTGTPPPESRWRQSFLVEHVEENRPSAERVAEPGDDNPAAGSGRGLRAIPTLSAIRTTSYIYVEYATGDRELYDLRRDPFELVNIINRVPRSMVRFLEARLGSLRRCAAAVCRTVEDAPVPAPLSR